MDTSLERSPLPRQNLGLTQQPLDESTLAIMNVFENTLDARSCRDETARLRNKLQLYREADTKKANELKVAKPIIVPATFFSPKMMTSAPSNAS